MSCEFVYGVIFMKDLLFVWFFFFCCGFVMVIYEWCSWWSDVVFFYVMGLFISVLGFLWIIVVYIVGEWIELEYFRFFSFLNFFGFNEYEYGNGEKIRSWIGIS